MSPITQADTVPLTPEQIRAVKRHIAKRTSFNECFACGGKNLLLAGPVMSMLFDERPSARDSLSESMGVPLILLVCEACGFSHQFSWGVIKEVLIKAGEL